MEIPEIDSLQLANSANCNLKGVSILDNYFIDYSKLIKNYKFVAEAKIMGKR